jgi:hypothetical protein
VLAVPGGVIYDALLGMMTALFWRGDIKRSTI